MSDEDAELKDVLLRSLYENGILSTLRAQLRAAVYLALEKHNYGDGIPPTNEAVRSLHGSQDGLLILSLVADFLGHSCLSNTLEVFVHEAELNNLPLSNADDLCSTLGVNPNVSTSVLATLLSNFLKSNPRTHNSNSDDKENVLDGPNHNRCSRIPVLNRRSSAPLSYPPPPSSFEPHNERGDNVDPLSRSPSAASATVRSLPNGLTVADGDVESSKMNGAASSSSSPSTSMSEPPPAMPSRQSKASTAPQNATSSSTNLNQNRLDESPSRRTLSSRDPDYLDDFDSPRSPGSRKTINTESPRGGAEQHSTNGASGGLVSPAHQTHEAALRTITPNSITASERSNRGARSSSASPVIRVYARSSRRPPADDVSDVDEAEDEDEEAIPEMLKAYSVSEDSVPDQTIDSDESLGLDHVEEVPVRPNPSVATTEFT